ncbi:hypothetical protein N0V93_004207 [Gnomoniopsis smithogilvyi]|uniref:Uncharacterized protein n=1 Tax=Gnomoniopsis smithogilvyi TaxID=1191159 RepID=A0A9W8YQN2_9PEZI|nr:hypothetical protein N0V93_004207 [Gnomoniopsis smithogilvyi]
MYGGLEPGTPFAPFTWKWQEETANESKSQNFEESNLKYPLDQELQVPEASRKLSRALASLTAPNFRLYTELVYRFNNRNFANPEDALPAFSGVIDAFTCGFRGSFVSEFGLDYEIHLDDYAWMFDNKEVERYCRSTTNLVNWNVLEDEYDIEGPALTDP